MGTINQWILFIIVMTITGAFGSYFFKRATKDGIGLHKQFLVSLLIGGFLYLASAVINIIVLKHMPYKIVFPLTSITYIWTMAISYYFLKETITSKKVVGLLFIIIGSVLLVV